MVKLPSKNIACYAAIIALSVAVYCKALFFGITNSDDEVLITANLPFLQDLSSLFRVFVTDAFYQVKSIDLYRPLQSASFILDAQWGINTVLAAHATNLLLHILCCIAIFHLLQYLEIETPLAVCGALVYAVHYLFMTAVVWIPARGDLLLALFSFLSLLTFIRVLDSAQWRYYVLHALCFALTIFSKESGVVLPLLLVAYVAVYAGTVCRPRRIWILPGYYAVVIAVALMLKSFAVTSSGGVVGVGSFVKNSRFLPESVARFYLPLNMSTLPQFKPSATFTGLLLLAGLLFLTLRYRQQLGKRALFGIAWFLLFIIPGMTYYPNFYSFAYEHIDHRSYITCFGLLLLNLQLVQLFRWQERKFFKPVMLLILIWLAAANLHFSDSYRNAESFALRAITTNPYSAKAYANYGAEKFLQGDELEALRNLNRSLRICSNFMPALHYRARIYHNRGMLREALADLDAIFSVDPQYDIADYLLRGRIKFELRDYVGARADIETALRLAPENGEAVNLLDYLNKLPVRGAGQGALR